MKAAVIQFNVEKYLLRCFRECRVNTEFPEYDYVINDVAELELPSLTTDVSATFPEHFSILSWSTWTMQLVSRF